MLEKKAANYYLLARIAEKLGMRPEAASNYFKALTALNDLVLSKIGLIPKDHNERFFLLKQHNHKLYEITDKLFTVYRRTYVQNIDNVDLNILRKNVEIVFKNEGIKIPSDEEIEETIRKISKK